MKASIRTMIDGKPLCRRHQYPPKTFQRNHPHHDLIAAALRGLVSNDMELCFTPQNLGEFWNVSTRPSDRNGFGWSIGETDMHLHSIERRITLLHDDQRVHPIWRRLLLSHNVRGVQVHDARLAAVLEVHEVSQLLTFNSADFKRFPDLQTVHPQQVQLESS